MIDDLAKKVIINDLKSLAMVRAREIRGKADKREVDEFIANNLKTIFDEYELKSPLEIGLEAALLHMEAMREEAERHDADRSDS